MLLLMAIKDVRRKSSIAVFILLIISSLYIAAVVGSLIVQTEADKYWEMQLWPTEIIVHPLGDMDYFPLIAKSIERVDGVKWTVYPSGIWFNNIINYNNKSYSIRVGWCNLNDITFPNPRYLVEGRFFKSNNEYSIIIESIGEQLLKDVGQFNGVHENKTILTLGSFNFTVIGVISNPLILGREESYLKLTNAIMAYIPIQTYLNLYDKLSNFNMTELAKQKITFDYSINVKVEEGYNIDAVADKIRSLFSDVIVSTINEYRKNTYNTLIRDTLYPALIGYILSAIVMVWEIKQKTIEIALLKIMGWTRISVLELFVIHYILFGALAGLIGLIVAFAFSAMLITPNIYLLYLFFTYLPIQLGLTVSLTVLFAIPAVIKAYNTSAESILRM